MRVENSGDPVLEHDGFVREAHQVVVDVTEPVGHLVGDERKLAAREPADDVALWNHDPPQRRQVALQIQDLAYEVAAAAEHGLLLHAIDALFQFLDFRPVVVHHRVDDAVQEGNRTFGQDVRVLAADLTHPRDGA